MRMTGEVPVSVAEYIGRCAPGAQKMLRKLRAVIRKSAPDAEERISYRMPAYFQDGVLVYFAACRKHIGFYPTGEGVTAFTRELRSYKHAKGSVQFPLDEPLPTELIAKIVRFRVAEVKARASEQRKKK